MPARLGAAGQGVVDGGAQTAAGAVTSDRVADFAAGGETDMGRAVAGGHGLKDETGSDGFARAPCHALEIAASGQAQQHGDAR